MTSLMITDFARKLGLAGPLLVFACGCASKDTTWIKGGDSGAQADARHSDPDGHVPDVTSIDLAISAGSDTGKDGLDGSTTANAVRACKNTSTTQPAKPCRSVLDCGSVGPMGLVCRFPARKGTPAQVPIDAT